MSLTQGHRESVARGYEIAARELEADASDYQAEGDTAAAAQARERAADNRAAARNARRGGHR